MNKYLIVILQMICDLQLLNMNYNEFWANNTLKLINYLLIVNNNYHNKVTKESEIKMQFLNSFMIKINTFYF